MDHLISLDQKLALLINGLSGHSAVLDEIAKGLANDYFLPVVFCLVLLALWFAFGDGAAREVNQKGVLGAVVALGIANGVVEGMNALFYRARPYMEIPVRTVLYQPLDSSLPSNAATVLFAVATAVWFRNRRVGGIMFILAAIEGLSRIYVGMHFPLDVVSGAVLGVFIGWVVNVLFRVFDPSVSRAIGAARRLFLA